MSTICHFIKDQIWSVVPRAMVSYFTLLEKENLCPSCKQYVTKSSPTPTSAITASQLLERPLWLRSVKIFLDQLSNCTSIKTCSRPWSFLAILFRPQQRFAKTNHPVVTAWRTLSDQLAAKVASIRQEELQSFSRNIRLSRLLSVSETSVSETSSVLLLSADTPSYFHSASVSPFIRQLQCYAQRRHMRLLLDSGPWPVRYLTVGHQPPYSWSTHWMPNQTPLKGSKVTQELSLVEEQLRSLLVDLMLHGKLQRASELLSWDRLNVYSEDPTKMTKIWSIRRQLKGNSSLVVYLDTDVIIRPDSLQSGLVPLLLFHSNRSGQPSFRTKDIFVRDSHPGTECVNIGFLAVRNSRATQVLLDLWQQKSHWSAFWDQSALAESLLELIGLEMQKLGKGLGYRSQCLQFLFPAALGEVPYNAYCDCWQDALRDMIGPYRQRRSRIVSFVDPEELDVNFVPNDAFWDHGFTLEGMHLVPGRDRSRSRPVLREIMQPLIIHWAGVGNQDMRLHFVNQYLKQKFNTSFSKGTCSRLTKVKVPQRFNSRVRLVRCCKNLMKRQEQLELVDFREMCYWGCCEWKPIRAGDCQRLMVPSKRVVLDLLVMDVGAQVFA